MQTKRLLTLGLVFWLSAGWAQTADEGAAELELFELDEELSAETKVASQRAQNIRETPGVVTVINREEITRSGARDLLDVLKLVPGFAFGVDVEGAVGVGFRGNWGHEGKVLLMIDGVEVNENLYSTLQFGNHYPINDVQRVEVIRGPGSVAYGGYAELAVVNVITRSAKDYRGASATLSYGQYGGSYGHRNLGFSMAQELSAEQGLSATVSGFIGQGQRSDLPYRDFFGNEFSMVDANRTDPAFLNVGATWRDLHVRFLYDRYALQNRDAFDEAMVEPITLTFDTLAMDARYEFKPRDGVTVTPRLIFKQATPWRDLTDGSHLYYDKTTSRLTARLTLNQQITDEIDLVVGGELFFDEAWLNSSAGDLNTPFVTGNRVSYQNRSAFAELVVQHWLANLIVGARVEDHTAVGSSFVPRVAVTKLWRDLHFKALFSRAFRAPGIENINLGVDVKPENTQVIEVEAGYKLTDSLFVAANVFDIGIDNPIVYFYDEETEAEGYKNFTRTGTRGAEAELRFRRKGMWATLGYSLYVANGNEVDSYAVEGRDDVLLGLPAHKVTFNSGFNVWRDLHVNPSAMFLSERYGYLSGVDGESAVEPAPAALVVNLFATYRDLGVQGLDFGVGIYDLLGAAPAYLQPYAGGHAPLPGPGREFRARLNYTYLFE